MKTTAWTPNPALAGAEFALDEEAYFYSAPAKVDKRMTLIGAVLAGAAYAGMGLPFEIRKASQELIAVFEPGQAVRAYPAVMAALFEASAHLDQRAKMAVRKAIADFKQEAVQLYAKGVEHGMEAAAAAAVANTESAAPDTSTAAADAAELSQAAQAAQPAPQPEAPPAQ